MQWIKKYIGNRSFYKKVLIISIPLILQQLLLNTFGIVDTIMVGSIYRGVAGVGIAAQISMIIFTVVFGINSGIGIYVAQFFGAKDDRNLKNSFALGIVIVCFFVLASTLVVLLFPKEILMLFSQDMEVIDKAMDYIKIEAFSYIFNALSFSFSIAYRNIQKTKVPLYISIVSSSMNILFNYLLIFGIGPFPELGVKGAAIATVISCFVGFVINIIYAQKTKQLFMPSIINFKEGLNKIFVRKLIKRVGPLIANEMLFSIGTALYVVFINTLGSDAYEGYRIAESIVNIMFTITFGLATAVAALIGEALGKKDLDLANNYGNWFLLLGMGIAISIGILNLVLAPLFVALFNNPIDVVVENAIKVLRVYSIRIMFRVFIVILFSTFRAGGESKYVMFLDSGILWLIGIPIAFLTTKVFHVQDVALFYLILQTEQLVRVIIGMRRYNKRTWLKNITDELAIGNGEASK